jgi:holliday junction DNA helicase RuvA
MIGHIRGQLMDKRPPWMMIDVSGVGYELEAPMTVFYELAEIGTQVAFYTHFVVREDAQLLFAFVDRYERELFRALIKVNGVGPKLALSILSGMEAPRLVSCIEQQDVASLVKVPGVGKKTAERLVIEMSDRLAALEGSTISRPGQQTIDMPADAVQDAVAALESLGYRPRDAQAAVAKVEGGESLSSEELIRSALKRLAR